MFRKRAIYYITVYVIYFYINILHTINYLFFSDYYTYKKIIIIYYYYVLCIYRTYYIMPS